MDWRKFTVVLGAVLLVGTGGTAFATITSSGAQIDACANRKTGLLRLAQHCRSNERRVSWAQQATGATSLGYAYVAADKTLVPGASRNVIAMTRSADGDYYCFDLAFTPVNVVVTTGIGGSYIVADVVGANTLAKERATALCGTAAADAVVYFPRGESGFYANFN
jgi:hypothetical protein